MSICKHEEQSDELYSRICLQCGLALETYDDFDWTEYPDNDEEDDEAFFDCGWVRGVGCQLAGTEQCDFECPDRDANYKGLRLAQARIAKRKKP